MALDPIPLRNAVQRLREGLARHQAEPADEQLRDGPIQPFEFGALIDAVPGIAAPAE